MRPSSTHIIPPLGERDCRMDYLKGILFLLMIAFHLAYFSDGYPMAKQFVCTFHMPEFLVISGCLMNLNKPTRLVWKSLKWLVVPYLLMEACRDAWPRGSCPMPCASPLGYRDARKQ